eukprot:TRINITY_DN4818_c0_g2_i1.p1 TRINITY_DN4818_c0_g2~~TRINITY_DN4818_c0_g2_i1.p1  ORF type:complete len:671 (-),score=167.25 TRINITY_DN4818_c0_g2_i1:289-2301(-)
MNRQKKGKSNDPQALQELLEKHKLEGEARLHKFKTIQGNASNRKESAKKKSHKFEWNEEDQQFKREISKFDTEIEQAITVLMRLDDNNSIFHELQKENSLLDYERQKERQKVFQNLHEFRQKIINNEPNSANKLKECKNQLNTSKFELDRTIDQLESEISSLKSGLEEQSNSEYSLPSLPSHPSIENFHTLQSTQNGTKPPTPAFYSDRGTFVTQIEDTKVVKSQSMPFQLPSLVLPNNNNNDETDFNDASSAISIPISTTSTSTSIILNSPKHDSLHNLLKDIPNIYFLDQDVIENLSVELNSLDDWFRDRLISFRTAHYSNSATPHISSEQKKREKICEDGWDFKSHYHFSAVYKQCVKKNPAAWKPLLIERLQREMPNKTLEEIEAHLAWYEQHKYFKSKVRDIKTTWQRERKDFLDNAYKLVTQLSQDAQNDILKEGEREIERLKSKLAHEKVDQWKIVQEEKEEIEKERKKKEEEERILQEKIKEELFQEHRKQTKVIAEGYKQKKRNKKEMQELEEQQKQEQLEIESKQQGVKNKGRIKYREEKLKQKQDLIEEQKKADALKDAEKELRLEKLRSKVAVEVPDDPSRFSKETVSSSAPSSNTPNIFETHGYSDDKIFSDKRFKLQMAFSRAGLLNSEYAQKNLVQHSNSGSDRRSFFSAKASIH